jgi:hypothetical protein
MASGSVQGGCLCGAVRFELQLPPGVCAHCHCSMCRRAHGAGYVTWILQARSSFRLLSGEQQLVRYRSSSHGVRSFCGACGSSLFFEDEERSEQIDVAFANLDDPLDVTPTLHVFFDDRAAWVHVGDDLPRLGGETGLEPLG